MRLTYTPFLQVISVLIALTACAFGDDKEKALPGEKLAVSFEAAAKHLTKLPPNAPTARISDWREKRIVEIGKTPVNVVRFVERIDREIVAQVFESTGIVAVALSGYAEKESLYVVITPIVRPWESYMSADEKREYGRETGWRESGPNKRFASDTDRHRDTRIETECKRRKDRIENIRIKVKRSEAMDHLEKDTRVRITFRVRDLTVEHVAMGAPQKLCIRLVDADLVSLEPLKQAPPPDTSMLGLGANGHRFVFVLDFSGSVTVVADEIKRTLTASIDALDPTRSFEVIVTYSQSEPKERFVTESFASELTKAEPASKRRFAHWLERKVPRGQTEPLSALRRGIELRPDAVFFISDGLFDNSVVDDLTKSNRLGVPIHCVVFDEALINDRAGLPRASDGQKRMQALASKNKGKTKIVLRSDLERQ